MSKLRENLNSFNWHFDSAYKASESLREQFLALEKAKTAAEKRAAALQQLFSVFPDETQNKLLKYVDTLSRGLPLFSPLNVMATFAQGVKTSKEYAAFIEWTKQQSEKKN
ncbi:MAG: hypothetical protein M3367_03170 [Acidobacteriota bacterium]|nr:hypothetical protein [Acidobacteriota bacterium]